MIWGGKGLFLNSLWKTSNFLHLKNLQYNKKNIEQGWTNLVPYQVCDGTHYYNDLKWLNICVIQTLQPHQEHEFLPTHVIN